MVRFRLPFAGRFFSLAVANVVPPAGASARNVPVVDEVPFLRIA